MNINITGSDSALNKFREGIIALTEAIQTYVPIAFFTEPRESNRFIRVFEDTDPPESQTELVCIVTETHEMDWYREMDRRGLKMCDPRDVRTMIVFVQDLLDDPATLDLWWIARSHKPFPRTTHAVCASAEQAHAVKEKMQTCQCAICNRYDCQLIMYKERAELSSLNCSKELDCLASIKTGYKCENVMIGAIYEGGVV